MPSPFSLMHTIRSAKGVSRRTTGSSSPECITSATCSSRRLPRLPAGWLSAKSSGVKARARNSATASASPKANAAVVLLVGARPSGQASCGTATVRWMSAWRASVDSGRPVMPIKVMFLRLSAGRITAISSLSPELEMASTTSPSTIMPKSPCAASAGCTKKAGVPVEASVAAILRPICPLLPMPLTTTRPSQASTASQAREKLPSNESDRARNASASIASTSRAWARYCCSLIILLSSFRLAAAAGIR